MGRVKPHGVDYYIGLIQSNSHEFWENRKRITKLEYKLALLEKHLGVRLVETKEHYQKVEESNG